ncbi:tyrosine-type recombinase/integrase [Tunturiibacter lichenicola]|uniref:tyrosine-type recombinase/integrase n=1 Tax=Tunturiibacter lichenicola TaxID=2051959 RepID=UPI003D9B562F
MYQRNGKGSWYVRYFVNGKKVRKSFGNDRSAAIAYIEKTRTILRDGQGIVPTSAKQVVRTSAELASASGEVTLGELADALLKQIVSDPGHYKDQHNPPLRLARIKKEFGLRPAASIRPSEVSDWLKSLDVAKATMNRYRTQFSSIYTYGKERELVTVNPVRDVKSSKVGSGIIRYMDDAEEVRLRKVLQADVDSCQTEGLRKRYQHHLYELDVALKTGMRRGEMYSLLWDQVDFHRKEIVLTQTKNGSARTVHMIDDVIAAMKGLRKIPMVRKSRSSELPNQAPDNAVFALGDNKKWWASATRRARIKNLRWHDLRHTFCSRLAQAGFSIKVIQEAAGHKTIQMAARYMHLDKRTLVDAMKVLNSPR